MYIDINIKYPLFLLDCNEFDGIHHVALR